MSQHVEQKENKGISIKSFKGWHPPSHLMETVASPPYDVLTTKEAKALIGDNEKSFLNVNKPECHFPSDCNPYDDKVYEMGRQQIDKFCDNQWLVQDKQRCFYIYSQTMGNQEQFGLVAEASAIQYEQDRIKKHELTRKKKEDDRTKLTDIQSANVGPIFLCYKSQQEINQIIADFVAHHKVYSDFIADDGVRHRLWIVDDQQVIGNLTQLFEDKVAACYVADGHHRTASAWRVYKQRKEELQKLGTYRGDEDFHYFLAVFFPHDQLNILDYNRITKDFGTVHKDNKESFLNAMSKDWNFEKLEEQEWISKTQHSNDYRMYVANDGWYALSAKQHVLDEVKEDVVKRLDVSILSDYCLDPIMGIKNIRSDPNIGFMGGIHGLSALRRKVDEQGSGVAFGLYHTTIQQLLDVADAKQLMPPKSTWFEPKLRSGVIVRRF